MTPAALHITEHCLDRLAERLGVVATREAIHAALAPLPAIQAALTLGGTGRVVIPDLGLTLVMQNGSVVTAVLGRYGRRTGWQHRAGTQTGRRPEPRRKEYEHG